MPKSQSNQSERYRPGGPGTSYKPTKSPVNKSAKIPSKTISTGSDSSHNRGRQG